ncbi:MAG: hypothetical protein M1836_003313 [Candelina mexicana]|nr:MAG: hypothetical protein M1836_003313 [Candelina mexicana]
MATSITLDTNSTTARPSIRVTSLCRSLSNPLLLLAILLFLPLPYYIYHDYKVFISLGPGGTPATVTGYLRISFLRIFALRDPCSPYPIPEFLRPATGFLNDIPQRSGPRPEVIGIAPHRQTTQKGSSYNFAALSGEISELARRHPNRLITGTSCFEKHGTGIFSVCPANRTCEGEICHTHPSDGSLHMTLHLADAQIVLKRGWGERHPLAKGGWLTRFVPTSFVMVYAPRNEEELIVVMEIIRASAWWVSGQVLERDGLDNFIRDSGGKGYGEDHELSCLENTPCSKPGFGKLVREG